MRVITMNLNGVRSAASKGFFTWLEKQDADVVCLQETRANEEQLTDKKFHLPGYYYYYCCAEKAGYSGVGILCKKEPDAVITSLGWHSADSEGRYLEAKFGDLHIVSVYLPSGSSGPARQEVKYAFLDEYIAVLKKQIKSGKQYILAGDWNIAHQNVDLKNWRTNQKTSGFLPEERAWLTTVFDEVGFVDAYRYFNPNKTQYTFWSTRGNAWNNDVGWRIDYQIITPELAKKITHTDVYRHARFSDHAPLIIDYNITIKA